MNIREGWWRRAHRRSGGGGSFQRQVLALLWREEGRALRTTAMVISSFTCCWLPFFVWLLPFQLQHSQSEPSTSSSSVGVFLARLAAFSNVCTPQRKSPNSFFNQFPFWNRRFLLVQPSTCIGTRWLRRRPEESSNSWFTADGPAAALALLSDLVRMGNTIP